MIDIGKRMLLQDSLDLLDRSVVLKKSAQWLSNQIDKKFKIIEDNEDDLEWDKKEQIRKDLDELKARLILETKELIKLDKDYTKLRKKINKLYNKEIFTDLDPLDINKLLNGEL